ncbi:uncharacterized protein BCR38DRAFT_471018 [Pseudomassariella vexata]|uniref:Uncharacterized protein n=1 Tax=Pseudomassariella vexata TaxID=1141098 RepID=A0A1Y2ED71_9PEZI|nr:uncharacterized protein BCR38DRAFT_471018 [Pseudomassariella vexata]ORY69528.1 hypothetical protein BCR38DRAFT_471018 [Pseudomassariella vexata]
MRPFNRFPGTASFGANISALKQSICSPPCRCEDCQTGFYMEEEQWKPEFSYRRRLLDKEAEAITNDYIEHIAQNREYLAQRLQSRADLLMSRWRKRSTEKRQALLTEAAPDIALLSWTLPRYSYDPERKLIDARTLTRRRQLLAPWLNIEVLKNNPMVLYALLHYRVAYPPQDWAAFDCRQLTLSWACGWIDVDYSPKCVVMYGPRYGELVNWSEGPAHRSDILGFPRARLVLEVQGYIMAVLRSVVDKILEGADETLDPRALNWAALTGNAGFGHTGEVEFWSPYTNQAFSAPPKLELNYLLSLAKTRLDSTADHLWNLQCDVAYMRRYLKVLGDMTIFKLAEKEHAASRIADELLREVFDHFWWRWLEIECRHVAEIQHRFQDGIHPGHPLPTPYDRALSGLEIILVDQVIYRAQRLGGQIPFSKGFSRHWTLKRESGIPKGMSRLTRTTPTNTQESLENDQLDWILTQLQGHPGRQTHFEHSLLFNMLQSHLASNSREKSRLDERMYGILSDLSTCHEMLVAILLNRPQNKNGNMDDYSAEERGGWKRLRNHSKIAPQRDLEAAGSKLLDDFAATKLTGVPKSMKTLQCFRDAHVAMKEFWSSMRVIVKNMLANSAFSDHELRSLLNVMEANESPEYIKAMELKIRSY